MECPVCFLEFNLGEQTAIRLFCGHMLCRSCCNNQLKFAPKISCPQCFQTTNGSEVLSECATIKRILHGKSKQFDFKPAPSIIKNDNIRILLRNFRNRFVELTIPRSITVFALKTLIKPIENIPEASQLILFNGVCLNDFSKLEDYNITKNSVLTLVTRSFGG